jgi:4-hydroxy-3-methylbut-2-en-1-yl diphosphate reductase
MMRITIDENSGFCFGVVNAIRKAEEELEKSGSLYCLGDIVHNNAEVERLKSKGLISINKEQFKNLKDCKVLIRAHGEPPETYEIAKANHIELVDASCNVVLKLQARIRKRSIDAGSQEQIVIFGKEGHAEVNGLVGQTQGKAIVIKELSDIERIDFSQPIHLFSQTTMSIEDFILLSDEIRNRMLPYFEANNLPLYINDTICRQVANRAPQLRIFAAQNDVVVFVGGKDSSNGKVLYGVCKKSNPSTYFISGKSEIELNWFQNAQSIGICGATSTPRWLMDEIGSYLEILTKK